MGKRGKPFPRAQVPAGWWQGQGRGKNQVKKFTPGWRMCLHVRGRGNTSSSWGGGADGACGGGETYEGGAWEMKTASGSQRRH